MKETYETVEIVMPVRITYRTTEGRAEAIKMACEGLFMDVWSSRTGSISVKTPKGKKGRLLEPKP